MDNEAWARSNQRGYSITVSQGATTHLQAGQIAKPHCCRVDVWTPPQPRGEWTSGQRYSNQGQQPPPKQRELLLRTH